MNSKILLAFFAGAVLASGIVYMAVQNEHSAAPTRLSSAPVKPIYINPEPAQEPAANREAQPNDELPGEPQGDPQVRRTQRDQVRPERAEREKPSPTTARRNNEVARVIRPEQTPPRTEPPVASPAVPAVSPTAPQQPAPTQPAPTQPAAPQQPSAAQPTVVQPAPPAAQPQTAPEPPREPAPSAPPVPEPPQPHTVTIAAGTILPVRIGETINSERNQPGDTFLATLDRPLIADGFVIAERGARIEGRIVEVQSAGRVKGVSHLAVELVKLSTADGQHVRIRTSPFEQEGESSVRNDAAKVGIGAAIGAAIGGIAGGGKGAGIGAGVGGAAGAGDVLLTRGKAATIPVETRLSFRLQEPVTITERLR